MVKGLRWSLPASLLAVGTATGCGTHPEPSWLPGGSAGQTEGAGDEDPNGDEDASSPPEDDATSPDAGPSPSGDPSETESDGTGGNTGPAATGDSSDTAAGTTTGENTGSESSTGEPVDPPPFDPLYRIDVRIHRGNSSLTNEELVNYLTEMNVIWREQAAVCFEFEVVEHDDTMTTGFDLWFQPEVGGPNGYYAGDHDVWVRDYPSLGSAPNPVEYGGARTAAHELGHGLTLDHDQSSDDYLMRSGTHGFEIPAYQITASRARAAEKALEDTSPLKCAAPMIP